MWCWRGVWVSQSSLVPITKVEAWVMIVDQARPWYNCRERTYAFQDFHLKVVGEARLLLKLIVELSQEFEI